MNCLNILSSYNCFSFNDFVEANVSCGVSLKEPSLRKKLQEYLDHQEVIRIGRGLYCVSNSDRIAYSYKYSDLSSNVANLLKSTHPYMAFSVFELIQLNEFVNHQFSHNIVFVSVDEEIMDFAFDTLKEAYPGKVLLSPNVELYHRYWSDDMIVVVKLATEAPKNNKDMWQIRLEKILVDLFAEPLLIASISEGEYPTILEDAFERYIVDESSFFRYAKRRYVDKKIKKMIREQTKIVLKTKVDLS